MGAVQYAITCARQIEEKTTDTQQTYSAAVAPHCDGPTLAAYAMSGHADYRALDTLSHAYFTVPVVRATPESLEGYARIVTDYDAEQVIIVPWPDVSPALRVVPGTGTGGGIVEGMFKIWYEGDALKAKNEAVQDEYVVGKVRATPGAPNERYLIVREANFHPDGGQVVFPETPGDHFIILMARPSADPDFTAFYCDGTFGIQILPNVWHHPVFPLGSHGRYRNKQSAVHACVLFDTVKARGYWLKVPLRCP